MTSSSSSSSSFFETNFSENPVRCRIPRWFREYINELLPRVQPGISVFPLAIFEKGREPRNVFKVHTKQSLANYFGVSLSTIHRLIRTGEIETIHVGRSVRITDEAVKKFIISHRGLR